MAEKQYDLAVLGAGPAGYVAAIVAAQLGLRVSIIDRDKVGGTCLNLGCIPTKALLKNAEVVDLMRHAKDFGISFHNLTFDYSMAVKRARAVAGRLNKGVEFLLKKNNVDFFPGEGSFAARDTLEVVNGAASQKIRATNILIATGSRPKSLPGLKIDGVRVLSSDDAVFREELPSSVVIIGAGAVGVEFAYIYAAYGVPVTLLEMMPTILPLEDREVSQLLTKSFEKMGMKVITGCKVEKVQVKPAEVSIAASTPAGGIDLEADVILVAVGREAVSDINGLEAIGVTRERGFIVVNDKFQTAVQGIYAVGDVIGTPLLAHAASAEGHVAVKAMAGRPTEKLNYDNIPSCIYCQPQVASVGLTEEEALKQGHEIKVGRFPFRANGKALAIDDYEGFVKIITDARYNEILGAHIIGGNATEMISEILTARTLEGTPAEIARTVHPHPTLSEAIMEASAAVYGQAVHI